MAATENDVLAGRLLPEVRGRRRVIVAGDELVGLVGEGQAVVAERVRPVVVGVAVGGQAAVVALHPPGVLRAVRVGVAVGLRHAAARPLRGVLQPGEGVRIAAQGRMARWIVSLLPVFLFIVLYFLNRDYLRPLWEESVGKAAIVVAAVLIVSGSLIIKKIVEIRA